MITIILPIHTLLRLLSWCESVNYVSEYKYVCHLIKIDSNEK